MRSLLDLVRNRKESIKKDDKKPKSPTASSPPPLPTSPPPTIEPELPCYDDVSNLNRTSEEEDYLSPPPPRPIYSRPPTIIKCAAPEDEYDDIGGCIEVNGNTNGCKGCANVDVIKDYPSEFASKFHDWLFHYIVN